MHVRVFFPAIFLLPVCRFSIFVFIAVFFYISCSFMKVKANAVCVRTQASILRSVLAIQSKKLPNCRRRPNNGCNMSGQKRRTLKRKTLEDKQGLNGGFLTNCVRNVSKKQSIRVIIHQERQVKGSVQPHTIKVSSTTVNGDTMTDKAQKILVLQRKK